MNEGSIGSQDTGGSGVSFRWRVRETVDWYNERYSESAFGGLGTTGNNPLGYPGHGTNLANKVTMIV